VNIVQGIIAPVGFGRLRKLQTSINFATAGWNEVRSHEVFTVTGFVSALVFYRVTQSLTSGGAATVAFGDQGSTGRYSAAQAYTNLTAGNLVSPGATVSAFLRLWNNYFVSGTGNNADNVYIDWDLGYEIAAAALTGGIIEATCFWTPISDGATVALGNGEAL